jgi:hypothetical protein
VTLGKERFEQGQIEELILEQKASLHVFEGARFESYRRLNSICLPYSAAVLGKMCLMRATFE